MKQLGAGEIYAVVKVGLDGIYIDRNKGGDGTELERFVEKCVNISAVCILLEAIVK